MADTVSKSSVIPAINGGTKHTQKELGSHQRTAHAEHLKAMRITIDELDQPQAHYRFRYATEGQSGAILTSISTSKANRRCPTVTVHNYTGWLRIRCSCVTAEGPPFRPHPFRLTGQNCTDGIFECDKQVTDSDRQIQLRNVGIHCVKLRELRESANLLECFSKRRARNVNPFNTRWDDFDVKQDGHSVRLCFEAIPINACGGQPIRNLPAAEPVVTTVIHGKLTSDDLKITRLSQSSASADGQSELIILCSKVQANDIRVRFFDPSSRWQQEVDVRSEDVHKQYAISVRVPRYRDIGITQPVSVRIQLIRPSTDERSREVYFRFVPCGTCPHGCHGNQPLPRELSDATPSDDEPSNQPELDEVSIDASASTSSVKPDADRSNSLRHDDVTALIKSRLINRKRKRERSASSDLSDADDGEPVVPANTDSHYTVLSNSNSNSNSPAPSNLPGVVLMQSMPQDRLGLPYAYMTSASPFMLNAANNFAGNMPFSMPFILLPQSAASSFVNLTTSNDARVEVASKLRRSTSVSSHGDK